jgi:nucleotide-binding universal stress UspA family protein
MISRILLAVDDSSPALAAAELAVAVAAERGARLRAVSVVSDGEITEHLRCVAGDVSGEAIASRRSQGALAALRHVAKLAKAAAVACETIQLCGDVAPLILEQARAMPADLIVVGRSDLAGAGQPYVGGHTRHVLEFAEVPVLVVPARTM